MADINVPATPGASGTARPKLLSILMPAYNERAYLRRAVERVLAAPLPDGLARELVLVEDASTDGTRELAERLADEHPDTVRVFFQEKNQGKGAALQRAIREMRGDLAIFQDADLEYDPDEYGRLLAPLLHGGADAVYGSRFAGGPERRVLNFHHELGNRFLTFVSNWLTGLNLTDMETCYKAFRADLLRTIPLRSKRFGIEPEITAKLAKRGAVVYEVPIGYYGRGYAEGKKIGAKDGFSALWTMAKYWLVDDCFDERSDGRAMLHALSRAQRYARWQARVLAPHLGRRILELGAGMGTLSRWLPKRECLTVADDDPEYAAALARRFDGHALVSATRFDPGDDEGLEALAARHFDTIVSARALQRVSDDAAALARLRRLLPAGGRLVLLVPQYPALFGPLDEAAGHCRRYRRAELAAQLEAAGFAVRVCRGFNGFSAPGWWLNTAVLKRKRIGRLSLTLFDTLVPVLRHLDRVNPLPGQSLLCVAEAR